MLKRLQDKRSEYDIDKFRDERKKVVKILKNISEHKGLYKPKRHFREVIIKIFDVLDEL
jgi:hypothetical protein